MVNPPVERASAVTSATFQRWVAPAWQFMADLAVRLVGARDAEDVVQEALAMAWQRRATYDEQRGTTRNWLLMLTAEQANRQRRRRRFIADPAAVVHRPYANGLQPDPDIARAVKKLSPRQRLAIELYYYLDLTVTDVAEVMNCSSGTVKSTLSDARTRLRATLGDEFRWTT